MSNLNSSGQIETISHWIFSIVVYVGWKEEHYLVVDMISHCSLIHLVVDIISHSAHWSCQKLGIPSVKEQRQWQTHTCSFTSHKKGKGICNYALVLDDCMGNYGKGTLNMLFSHTGLILSLIHFCRRDSSICGSYCQAWRRTVSF